MACASTQSHPLNSHRCGLPQLASISDLLATRSSVRTIRALLCGSMATRYTEGQRRYPVGMFRGIPRCIWNRIQRTGNSRSACCDRPSYNILIQVCLVQLCKQEKGKLQCRPLFLALTITESVALRVLHHKSPFDMVTLRLA